MSLSIWDVRFNSISNTIGGPVLFGGLNLYGEAGPDRVRVLWGATGPFGEPDAQTFFPEGDGSFSMPPDGRSYNDGSYIITAVGIFDATSERIVEKLNAFFDLNNTVGVLHIGNSRDDLISGGSGNDTFYGQDGTDWVFGGQGSDLLYGGNGEDFLGGGSGDGGADTLNGGAGSDLLSGDDGDDLLLGGTESDFMYGGEGNDSALGQDGNDFISGEAGDDTLKGLEGNDTLYGDFTPFSSELAFGNDLLFGGNGDDQMGGGGGDDVLRGEEGNDDLSGGEGNDTLIAGNGTDEFLYGNEGDDRLMGDAGFHRFNGGAGNDTMVSVADGETDYFVYGSVNEGYDRIIGFESDFDAFMIFGIDETNVGPGRLVGSVAEITDNGTWIVYEASGRLRIDLNGTDAGEIYNIAILAGTPSLDYSNFIFPAAA